MFRFMLVLILGMTYVHAFSQCNTAAPARCVGWQRDADGRTKWHRGVCDLQFDNIDRRCANKITYDDVFFAFTQLDGWRDTTHTVCPTKDGCTSFSISLLQLETFLHDHRIETYEETLPVQKPKRRLLQIIESKPVVHTRRKRHSKAMPPHTPHMPSRSLSKK